MGRNKKVIINNYAPKVEKKGKDQYIRGKDAYIYLGGLLTIIACMYNLLEPVFQVIETYLNTYGFDFSSIIEEMKNKVGTFVVFGIRFTLNLIGLIAIFNVWRLAEKRDLGE